MFYYLHIIYSWHNLNTAYKELPDRKFCRKFWIRKEISCLIFTAKGVKADKSSDADYWGFESQSDGQDALTVEEGKELLTANSVAHVLFSRQK